MSSHDTTAWPETTRDDDDDRDGVYAPTIAMPSVHGFAPSDETVPTNAAELEAMLAGDRQLASLRSGVTQPDVIAPPPAFSDERAAPVAQVSFVPSAPATTETTPGRDGLARAERGLRRYLWSGLALMVLPVFAIAMLFAGAPLGLMLVIEFGLQVALLWGLWSYRGLPAETGARGLATGAFGTLAAAVLPGLGAQIWAVVLFSTGTMSSLMVRAGLGLLVLLLLAPTMAFVGQLLLILSWRKVGRWADDRRTLGRTRTLIVLGSLVFVLMTCVQLAINAAAYEGAIALTVFTLVFGLLACIWWLLALSAVRRTLRERSSQQPAST